jgi:tRNA threonylcarbamoyladenosine biosynthesis protein TsaE
MTFQRHCENDSATQAAGVAFAAVLRPGDIVFLTGPLGAGKTTFTKGIARGLGVQDRVTSPTFTMVRQHEASNDQGIETLHHCDVYRIESLSEVLDLDLGELVEEAGVAIVEWGELAESIFGDDVLRVSLTPTDDESRTIAVSGAIDAERHHQLNLWSGA